MSTGFKVRPVPPPRSPVIAPEGAARCGERHETEHGTRCERLPGHEGGHLNRNAKLYWQAAS
jgi:hypothetical protein